MKVLPNIFFYFLKSSTFGDTKFSLENNNLHILAFYTHNQQLDCLPIQKGWSHVQKNLDRTLQAFYPNKLSTLLID